MKQHNKIEKEKMMSSEVTFLIIEDNDLDAEKVERSFKKLKIDSPRIRAEDGYEALQILRDQIPEKKIVKPYIILLDLNMPRVNGFEFLQEIRKDPRLKDAIVYVLTTSEAISDINEAYSYNVSGYIVKPMSIIEMIEALKVMGLFWKLCKLPQE